LIGMSLQGSVAKKIGTGNISVRISTVIDFISSIARLSGSND
jgi:hypothetical protein